MSRPPRKFLYLNSGHTLGSPLACDLPTYAAQLYSLTDKQIKANYTCEAFQAELEQRGYPETLRELEAFEDALAEIIYEKELDDLKRRCGMIGGAK